MPDKKNFLFIVIDQLRADCLFGDLAKYVDLPNLNALMDDAVTFQRHYSVANPCGPSRAAMLTGQYASNNGSTRNGAPLAHDTPNLATEARKLGYLPLLFGYTDTSLDPRQYQPNDPAMFTYEQVMPGFHEVVEMRMEESAPWRAHLISQGYDAPPYPDIYRTNGPNLDDPAFYKAEDSDTAFLTNAFLKDIAARPQGWFAHLTYIRPHPPLVAPEPYNKLVDPSSLPEPKPETDDHPFIEQSKARLRPVNIVKGFESVDDTPENAATLRAIYLGLAAEVDHHIGRVLQYLKDSGQYENTTIVVTADHGEMLGEQNCWGKETYYDAAYHTPLIIREPSASAHFGRIIEQPTESVDVTPTILDLLGVSAPDSMDGRSLRPYLEGTQPKRVRAYSFSELDFSNPVAPTYWQQKLGLRDEEASLAILRGPRFTLVQFSGDLPPVLFDHENKGEAVNIAGEPSSQGVLLDMSQRLIRHKMQNRPGKFRRTMITSQGVKVAPKAEP